MLCRFNQMVEDTLADWRQNPISPSPSSPDSRTHMPEEYYFTEMSKKFLSKGDYLLKLLSNLRKSHPGIAP
jgi:hypothetical protein